MIIWEKRKFSCATCTKGHRASKCSHTARTLTELKGKGRPASQCPACRTKREKGEGHSHHKCVCGAAPPKEYETHITIVFENGLELVFTPEGPYNTDELSTRVQQRQPFEITVMKQKEPSAADVTSSFIPKGININHVEVPRKMTNNPCNCHFGGECICSELPQERKAKSKVQSEHSATSSPTLTKSCCADKPKSNPVAPEDAARGGCCSSNTGGCGCGCSCSANVPNPEASTCCCK